jgi:hypothetical protein
MDTNNIEIQPNACQGKERFACAQTPMVYMQYANLNKTNQRTNAFKEQIKSE